MPTPKPLESVTRACAVLKAFANQSEMLTLSAIVARTGIEKTIAFRLVHTLEGEGLLRKAGSHRYCLNIRMLSKKPFCIGYAAEGTESLFSAAVTDSLRWAAVKNEIDLIIVDNAYSPKTALANARHLIGEHVNLAIEFQAFARIAPAVSALFQEAGIPLIAVGVPHPDAVSYGIDNYRAGKLAGQVLAKWAKQHWQEQADDLLLLGADIAGNVPQLRLSGAEASVAAGVTSLQRVQHLDTRGEFVPAFDAVRKYLRFSEPRRTLMVGFNDEAALGGLRAFEQCGRSEFCAAVALGGVQEARAELRMPGTRLVACVGFFPERYGENLIRLAIEILEKRRVPLSVNVQPQVITAQNVSQFYPTDAAQSRARPPVG